MDVSEKEVEEYEEEVVEVAEVEEVEEACLFSRCSGEEGAWFFVSYLIAEVVKARFVREVYSANISCNGLICRRY